MQVCWAVFVRMCWSLLPYSLASYVVCGVLITCRVYQGTPGVTVWSCLCLSLLVTAATRPSQLCGCGLLASVQVFMPPAWNMQVSESIVLRLFNILLSYVHVLDCFVFVLPKDILGFSL